MTEKEYIQEVVDPETEKHYNVHIYSCDDAPTPGFKAYQIYLTDPNPSTGVLVDIGRKAYAKDKFDSEAAMMEDFEKIIEKSLPSGFKRFEAIMASGLKGNELQV